jgi:predicted GNAT family acetyltransferase
LVHLRNEQIKLQKEIDTLKKVNADEAERAATFQRELQATREQAEKTMYDNVRMRNGMQQLKQEHAKELEAKHLIIQDLEKRIEQLSVENEQWEAYVLQEKEAEESLRLKLKTTLKEKDDMEKVLKEKELSLGVTLTSLDNLQSALEQFQASTSSMQRPVSVC